VDWLANQLGNATEVVCDTVVAATKAAWYQVTGRTPAEGGDALARGKSRLGRSQRAVRRASVLLGVVRSYREQLEQRLAAGMPLARPESAVGAELAKGQSPAEAGRIILDFLAHLDGELTGALTRVREIADADPAKPFDERRLRTEVRANAARLRHAQQSFAMADLLLSQLVTDPAVAPAGPCVELTHEAALSPAQEAELVAEHVTLAMSYGAFDWKVTRSEAADALEHLAELAPELRPLALARLSPKTRARLRAHLPPDVAAAHGDLVALLA
jgi:hypothetical protein